MTDRLNKIAIVGHLGSATATEIQILQERGFEVELVTPEQAKNLHLSSERIKPIQIESIDLPKLVMKSGRENRRDRRKQERKNRKR